MINIRETETQKIYITSDFHLGHQRDFVWQARGYESWEAHDAGVINTVNSIVRPTDILFMLGDFCLNTTMERFNGYLSRIQCQNLWCLWGNHNNPQEKNVYRKTMPQQYIGPFPVETYPFQYRNMLFLGKRINAVLNGQYAVLDHFPIYVWEEMQHGAWMLCGHSHYGCELSKAESGHGKILDVGWDGHGKPLSLAEIKAIMDKKQIAAVDHHHPAMKTQ